MITLAWSPVATSSESLLQHRDRTASSCIISSSFAWYLRSFLSFPVSWSHTSTNPSIVPETRNWPSGEKAAHSACDFFPNLIVCVLLVGYSSFSSGLAAAVPLFRPRVTECR